VGLAGKYEERFVLSFPTEAGNAAVVATGVETAANSHPCLGAGIAVEVILQNGIRSCLHQTQAKSRRGDAEDYVVTTQISGKVWLAQIASHCVGTAFNCV